MYDVVIVGAGPGGIFTAYELLEKRPDLSIAVFEMGNELTKRHCPIDGDKVKSCIHCKNCSIMSGFGGAGAFSDGKYNITTEYGGWLQDIMNADDVMKYIEQADDILVDCGATRERFMPNDELKKLCIQYDLYMQQGQYLLLYLFPHCYLLYILT